MDGGYAGAAVKRFRAVGGQLIIGPWDHGGSQDISPFTRRGDAEFDHRTELLDFFDCHLRGRERQRAGRVHFYILGAERWETSESWPPSDVQPHRLYLGARRRLDEKAAPEASVDTWAPDPEATTGNRARWNSLLGLKVPIGYGDCRARCEQMLCYDSPPLKASVEVIGQATVEAWIATEGDDAAVFAYLMDVAPDGRVTYITEGMLRALHRKGDLDRTYERRDGAPLEPGVAAKLCFEMLPAAYRLEEGHRIRLALAGADAAHFAPIEGGRNWDVLRGGERASSIELPVRFA